MQCEKMDFAEKIKSALSESDIKEINKSAAKLAFFVGKKLRATGLEVKGIRFLAHVADGELTAIYSFGGDFEVEGADNVH